jgi:hypothetical protein
VVSRKYSQAKMMFRRIRNALVPRTRGRIEMLLAKFSELETCPARARTNLLKDYEKKNAHNAHNAHKCSFIGFDWVFLLTTGFEFGYVNTEKRRAAVQK